MKMKVVEKEISKDLLKLEVEGVSIFLENFEKNQGKISISGYEKNYSCYWGSMGGTIQEFITGINDDYFVSKLIGSRNTEVFNSKKTFSTLRKYIREEIGLPWYKHLDFQKNLREVLNDFQSLCDEVSSPSEFFVYSFQHEFINRLQFYYIEDKYERERLEKSFNDINEQWYFIETTEGYESKWLRNLHKALKKYLVKK